jgi:hypothetical protein
MTVPLWIWTAIGGFPRKSVLKKVSSTISDRDVCLGLPAGINGVSLRFTGVPRYWISGIFNKKGSGRSRLKRDADVLQGVLSRQVATPGSMNQQPQAH